MVYHPCPAWYILNRKGCIVLIGQVVGVLVGDLHFYVKAKILQHGGVDTGADGLIGGGDQVLDIENGNAVGNVDVQCGTGSRKSITILVRTELLMGKIHLQQKY